MHINASVSLKDIQMLKETFYINMEHIIKWSYISIYVQ
jgi:hypothetical protein